jgi:hypothetical protein
VHDSEGGTTFCPGCHAALIVRDWYDIRRYDLTPEGRCPHCQTAIAGRFGKVLGRDGKRFRPQPHSGSSVLHESSPHAAHPDRRSPPTLASARLRHPGHGFVDRAGTAVRRRHPERAPPDPAPARRSRPDSQRRRHADLPLGIFASGEIAPAAIRAAAQRDTQVRASPATAA